MTAFATIPLDPQGRIASAYFTWTDTAGAIQTFVPDLVLEEEWTGNATITENPVEAGPNITDNIRVELRRCRLKFFLTQEPIEGNPWTQVSAETGPITIPGVPAAVQAAVVAATTGRNFTPPPSQDFIVPEWNNQLQARVLLGTASGLLGGAVGGAIGGTAGSLATAGAALAGSLVGGALFAGKVDPTPIQTNVGTPAAPAVPPVNATTITPDTEGDYVLQSIQLLAGLKSTGQTIDVYGTKDACIGTTLGIGGMAIESFTHVRAQDDGTGATVTLGFKEIRVVSTTTVPAPAPSVIRNSAPVNKGNQQTYNMEAEAQLDTTAGAASAFQQGEANGEADVLAIGQ